MESPESEMSHDPRVAEYMLKSAGEEIVRLFYLRGNEPMEFSHLRLALEAAGIKAESPNHWGSLSALLTQHGKGQMLEVCGRANAVAASRNDARNNVVKLTPAMWGFAKFMAEKRHWLAPQVPKAEPEQVALV